MFATSVCLQVLMSVCYVIVCAGIPERCVTLCAGTAECYTHLYACGRPVRYITLCASIPVLFATSLCVPVLLSGCHITLCAGTPECLLHHTECWYSRVFVTSLCVVVLLSVCHITLCGGTPECLLHHTECWYS